MDLKRAVARWLKTHSQRDLAKRLGVPQPNVARWMTGGATPSLKHANAMARIVGAQTLEWGKPPARSRPSRKSH